jgi:hypothetical protein
VDPQLFLDECKKHLEEHFKSGNSFKITSYEKLAEYLSYFNYEPDIKKDVKDALASWAAYYLYHHKNDLVKPLKTKMCQETLRCLNEDYSELVTRYLTTIEKGYK